jgi:hypothetical protein
MTHLPLDPLPEYTDLVTQIDGQGLPHSFARNWQGVHVPIETLEVEDLRRAINARARRYG